MVDLSESFDKQKMMEVLVDPEVSSILAELEGGEKSFAYLKDKLQLSSDQIKKNLSYVLEHNFVTINKKDGGKLSKLI